MVENISITDPVSAVLDLWYESSVRFEIGQLKESAGVHCSEALRSQVLILRSVYLTSTKFPEAWFSLRAPAGCSHK